MASSQSRSDPIRTSPCPGPRGPISSSGAPGNGDTLRPDTGRRQGRDPLPPLPHLKLATEPANGSSAAMTGQISDNHTAT